MSKPIDQVAGINSSSPADRVQRVRAAYEQAVYTGDLAALAEAERGLDPVEADVALARGQILHARFMHGGGAEDPAELPLFERAEGLYRGLGDERGQGEALFWIGCVHQFIRRDNDAAVPLLERSLRLATETGDGRTRAEALRHLGIAAHAAGRLDEARERLEESTSLRRELGFLPGVAANMVGLAYIAAAQGRNGDALAILDEGVTLARAQGAHAITRQLEDARAAIQPPSNARTQPPAS
ncbi:tetratricopeptide repeat protein [Actinoplanes sp. NPDC049596]|uniref:tetratricopeptide repeat protein n=1 Tax=unclassified Actinoplanes TaxID=2626549 RepID=UPI0034137190